MEPKYWAFISYSHADKNWADWLHHALETYRVPGKLVGRETKRGYAIPKRIFPIFRDREELPGSADLGQNITSALENSRYLLVICSPRAAVSQWVNEEIVTFKSLGREDNVLAIIIGGEPNATDKPESGQSECFPPGLRFRIGPNRELLPLRTEPIAADVRPGADGKARAKLKLLAGILGVNFDELAQREKRRQRRRLVLLLFASVVTSASIFGFYNHLEQHDQKLLQKQNEEARQQEQQKLKEQAEEHQAESETKLGRASLLDGNDHDAATHLAVAYRLQPQNQSVQVMLGAALRNLASLESDQECGLDDPVVSTENVAKSLLLTRSITSGAWRLIDLDSGQMLKASEPPRPGGDALKDIHLSPSGDSLLLVHTTSIRLESMSGAPPLDLRPPSPESILAAAIFSSDESKVYGSLLFTDHSKLVSWDAKTGACTEVLTSPTGQQDTLLAVDASAARATVIRSGMFVPGKPLPPAILARLSLNDGAVISSVPLNGYLTMERSPDGTQFLRTNSTGAPTVYDADGKALYDLTLTGDAVLNVHWNPSGKTLLSRNRTSVTLWDAGKGKVLFTWPNLAPAECMMDASEQYLAAANQDIPAAIYERSSGQQVTTLPGVTHVTAFSSDGSKLYDIGSRARIWDWKSNHPSITKLARHRQAITSLAFDSTGTCVAALSEDGSASIWDAAKGTLTCTTRPSAQIAFDFTNIAFCPDGKSFVTYGSRLGVSPAVIWDTETGQQKQQILFQHETDSPGMTMTSNVPAVYVALLTDGLIGGAENLIAIWDKDMGNAAAAQPSKIISIPNFIVRSLWLSPKQDLFAVAGETGAVRIYKTSTGDFVSELTGDQRVREVRFSSSNQLLTLDQKGICRVWNLMDPKDFKTLNSNTASINDAQFSPDGTCVFSGNSQGELTVWDAQQGTPLGRAMVEQPPPNEPPDLGPPPDPNARVVRQGAIAVGVTPDGQVFAGGLVNGKACLWARATGTQLLRHKFGEGLTTLCFNPKGNLVALGSNTGDIFLWDVSREQRPPDEVDSALKKIATPTPVATPADTLLPPPPIPSH